MRTPSRLLGLLLVAALGLGGCGSSPEESDESSAQPSSSAPTAAQPTIALPTAAEPPTPVGTPTVSVDPSWESTTPDGECPTGWEGLTVRAEVEAELPYLETVRACTSDGTQLWLRNNSDAVWVVTSPRLTRLPERTKESLRGVSFRGVVDQDTLGRTLLAPEDQVVFSARPTSVSWRLDRALNVAWVTHDITVDELESMGADLAQTALSRRSTPRAALAQCTLAGYQVGSTAAELDTDLDPQGTQSLLTDALGIGLDSSTCWTATKNVTKPGTPTLGSKLASKVSIVDNLAPVHTQLTWMQRGWRLVQAAVPRV